MTIKAKYALALMDLILNFSDVEMAMSCRKAVYKARTPTR